MFVDHRTHELKARAVREFLALHEKEGQPARQKHRANPAGFFAIEVGNVSGIVHTSTREDFTDRATLALRMAVEPCRQAGLICRSAENMNRSNNKILVPPSLLPTN